MSEQQWNALPAESKQQHGALCYLTTQTTAEDEDSLEFCLALQPWSRPAAFIHKLIAAYDYTAANSTLYLDTPGTTIDFEFVGLVGYAQDVNTATSVQSNLELPRFLPATLDPPLIQAVYDKSAMIEELDQSVIRKGLCELHTHLLGMGGHEWWLRHMVQLSEAWLLEIQPYDDCDWISDSRGKPSISFDFVEMYRTQTMQGTISNSWSERRLVKIMSRYSPLSHSVSSLANIVASRVSGADVAKIITLLFGPNELFTLNLPSVQQLVSSELKDWLLAQKSSDAGGDRSVQPVLHKRRGLQRYRAGASAVAARSDAHPH